MDSENGISRPTESSISFYLRVCVCLSMGVKGRKRWEKQTSHKCSKKLKTPYLIASTLHGKLEGNLRFFSFFMLLIVLKHCTQCIRRYCTTVLLL